MKTLNQVMEEHPLLHWSGYGGNRYLWPREERAARVAKLRVDLVDEESHCARVAAWLLERVRKNKGVNPSSYTSYFVKHVVEGNTKEYTSTGVLMAAAFMAEYPYEIDDVGVCFAMSKRDLDALDTGHR